MKLVSRFIEEGFGNMVLCGTRYSPGTVRTLQLIDSSILLYCVYWKIYNVCVMSFL